MSHISKGQKEELEAEIIFLHEVIKTSTNEMNWMHGIMKNMKQEMEKKESNTKNLAK